MFILSNRQEWDESSEELWYASEESKSNQPKRIYRILAVVLILASILILPGFLFEHSPIFVFFLEIFSSLILIYSFIHWDLVFKNKRKATP